MSKRIIVMAIAAALGTVGSAISAIDVRDVKNLVNIKVNNAHCQRPSFPNQKRRKARTGPTHRNTHRRRNSVLRHK